MSDDDAPKSAYELAMEKLRSQDDFEEIELTDGQKAEIADIRSRYKSQIAEIEIKNDSALRAVGSYEEAEVLRA